MPMKPVRIKQQKDFEDAVERMCCWVKDLTEPGEMNLKDEMRVLHLEYVYTSDIIKLKDLLIKILEEREKSNFEDLETRLNKAIQHDRDKE